MTFGKSQEESLSTFLRKGQRFHWLNIIKFRPFFIEINLLLVVNFEKLK